MKLESGRPKPASGGTGEPANEISMLSFAGSPVLRVTGFDSRAANLVHRPSGIKVDLFPAASFLDHQLLRPEDRQAYSKEPFLALTF